MTLIEYSWWGFDENSPPNHLKTKKQLSELGLKPGVPVGVIKTPKYDCCLYDPVTCPPKRPLTERQKIALEKKRLAKEQAELEKKRRWAENKLQSSLEWISFCVQDILTELASVETSDEATWRDFWVKKRCNNIITACHNAKSELKFLYPEPQPAPGSLVLGGDRVPLDPDGQCRVAVLGGKHPKTSGGQ